MIKAYGRYIAIIGFTIVGTISLCIGLNYVLKEKNKIKNANDTSFAGISYIVKEYTEESLVIRKNDVDITASTLTESSEVESSKETEVSCTENETEETVAECSVEEVKSYTDDELYIMSHIINAEAGGCSFEHQVYVGSVILNRVSDNRFPNTIKDVVFQSGQYDPIRRGSYYNEPTESSIESAIYVLENGSQLPSYCVFQAEFKQGKGVYTIIGNTYICY